MKLELSLDEAYVTRASLCASRLRAKEAGNEEFKTEILDNIIAQLDEAMADEMSHDASDDDYWAPTGSPMEPLND